MRAEEAQQEGSTWASRRFIHNTPTRTGKKTPGGAGTDVLADATTILLAAPAMSFKLTMGMAPF